MRKINCLIIVALLFFSGVAFSGMASAQIETSPSTIELDLIGGDTVIEQVTITWKGEATVVGFIETDITPNGEGINVIYSENPVVLFPNIPKTIDMIINVSINIVPDNYLITIVVFTEIEEIIKYISEGYKTIYETIYETIEIENLTRINELLVIIWQLQDEINETTDYSDLLPLISALQNATAELVIAIEDALDEEPEPEKKEDKWFFFFVSLMMFVIILFIAFIIMMACLYHKFRVLELQRIKEKKENETKTK